MSATSAWGTNYTYSPTIDLSTATYSTSGSFTTINFNLPSGQPTFQLNLGDTLSGTINFNGSLNFSAPAPFDALTFNIGVNAFPYANNVPNASGSIELLGVTGQLTTANPHAWNTPTGSYSPIGILYLLNYAHIGIAQTAPISFTGFTYSMTIISPLYPPPASYFPENFQITEATQNLSITVAPEPQTWCLLLGGLTLLVLLRGRRYLETR